LLQPLLGQKLRALRLARSLSLADVAERTGLSSSFLSLVEIGKSDIAIGRLMRLIDVYGVSLTTLFPEQEGSVEIVRRAEQAHIPSAEEGLDLVLLTSHADASMRAIMAIYEPGGRMEVPVPREGEAFVVVLDGTVGLEFEDGESYILQTGDTAYIRRDGARTYWNAGEGVARLLGVIARPT
jgi:transcriptional regulator with XRE-family HTH domain